MIATLQTIPSLWMLALVVIVLLVPSLWFLDVFGDKSQRTNSTTSLYENSFNTSTSEIQSLDGSTNVTLGGGESSGGGTSSIVVVAFAAVLILGGLYLVLRRK